MKLFFIFLLFLCVNGKAQDSTDYFKIEPLIINDSLSTGGFELLQQDSEILYDISISFPDSTITIYGDTTKAIRDLFKALLDCQNKKDTISEYYITPTQAFKKDTVPEIKVTDTTEYLSIDVIQKYSNQLKTQVTAQQYEDFTAIMQYIIFQSKKEWEDKHKIKK